MYKQIIKNIKIENISYILTLDTNKDIYNNNNIYGLENETIDLIYQYVLSLSKTEIKYSNSYVNKVNVLTSTEKDAYYTTLLQAYINLKYLP